MGLLAYLMEQFSARFMRARTLQVDDAITATGTVTAAKYIGDGSALTGILSGVTAAAGNGLFLNGSTVTLSSTSSESFGAIVVAGSASIGTTLVVGGNFTVTGGGTLTTGGAFTIGGTASTGYHGINVASPTFGLDVTAASDKHVRLNATSGQYVSMYYTYNNALRGQFFYDNSALMMNFGGSADGVGLNFLYGNGLTSFAVNGTTGFMGVGQTPSASFALAVTAPSDKQFAINANSGQYVSMYFTYAGNANKKAQFFFDNTSNFVAFGGAAAGCSLQFLYGAGTTGYTMDGTTGINTFARSIVANGTQNRLETFGLKSGSNKSCGTATLVAGTITVTNTRITANTIVNYSVQAAGGTQGNLSLAQTAAVGFSITSTSILDTSTIVWTFTEPY